MIYYSSNITTFHPDKDNSVVFVGIDIITLTDQEFWYLKLEHWSIKAVIAFSTDYYNNMVLFISGVRNNFTFFKVIFHILESLFDNFDSFSHKETMKVDVIIIELNLVVIGLENSPFSEIIGILNILFELICLLFQFFDLILASMFLSFFYLLSCLIKSLICMIFLFSGFFKDFLLVDALIIQFPKFVIDDHQFFNLLRSPKNWLISADCILTRDDRI